MSEEKQCKECGGMGIVYYEGVIGYITHDMAMDACDPSLEGQEIIGPLSDPCPKCNGTGIINDSV